MKTVAALVIAGVAALILACCIEIFYITIKIDNAIEGITAGLDDQDL